HAAVRSGGLLPQGRHAARHHADRHLPVDLAVPRAAVRRAGYRDCLSPDRPVAAPDHGQLAATYSIAVQEDTMTKMLTEDQVQQFRREGYVSPVRVMSEEAARAVREKLEAYERGTGGPLRGELRHKSHLLFKFLSDVVHHERIVDAIEDLYGHDLLCWTTNFFIKEANTPAFVSWHQD